MSARRDTVHRKRPQKKQPRKVVAYFSAGSGQDGDPAYPTLIDIGNRIGKHAEVVGMGLSGLSEPEYRGQISWCIFNAHAFVFVLTDKTGLVSSAGQIVRMLKFLVRYHEKNPKPVVWFLPTADRNALRALPETFRAVNQPLGWVPDAYWPHFHYTASADDVLDLVLGRR